MSEVSVTNGPVPMVPVAVIVREPFDTLYHREFAGLVRLAMVLVDSQEQAEEVVQDAFAALYLKYRPVSAACWASMDSTHGIRPSQPALFREWSP